MITLTIASGSGAPGDAVSLDLSIASTGGDQCAAVQWTFSYDADVTLESVSLGAAAIAASKSLSRVGDDCIIWSLPNNAIGDGVLVTAVFRISATPSSDSAAVGMATIVASDPLGVELSSLGVFGEITFDVLSVACPVDGGEATVNEPYSAFLVATGGTSPYSWEIVDGSLPPGFSLDEDTGEISGDTSSVAVFSYTPQATDSSSPPLSSVAAAPCQIVVSGIPTPGDLPCDVVVPHPITDNQFRLEKVIATMRPEQHLPTRGSAR